MPPEPSRFEQLAATGTDLDLFMAVAQAAFQLREDEGAEALTRVQRIAWAVWAASGAIGNGGFWDWKPARLQTWARAFDALGVADAAAAIRAAPDLMQRIRDGDGTARRELEAVEARFFALGPVIEQAIAAMIRQNPTDAFAGFE